MDVCRSHTISPILLNIIDWVIHTYGSGLTFSSWTRKGLFTGSYRLRRHTHHVHYYTGSEGVRFLKDRGPSSEQDSLKLFVCIEVRIAQRSPILLLIVNLVARTYMSRTASYCIPLYFCVQSLESTLGDTIPRTVYLAPCIEKPMRNHEYADVKWRLHVLPTVLYIHSSRSRNRE